MSDVDPDFDLDEDLFDFDEILAQADEETDKVDLEELLKVLESSPDPSPAAEEEDDDEFADGLIGAEPETTDHVDAANPTLQPVVPVANAATQPITAGAIPAAPVAAAAPSGGGIPRRYAAIALVIFLGLALLNVLSVGLNWERGRDVTVALEEMERRFLESTGDLRQELFHQSSAMERQHMPIVSPTGNATGLELAVALMADGRYAEARQRIYALLAVADRYDPETRADLEGKAAYLLGDTWLAEADDREAQP